MVDEHKDALLLDGFYDEYRRLVRASPTTFAALLAETQQGKDKMLKALFVRGNIID